MVTLNLAAGSESESKICSRLLMWICFWWAFVDLRLAAQWCSLVPLGSSWSISVSAQLKPPRLLRTWVSFFSNLRSEGCQMMGLIIRRRWVKNELSGDANIISVRVMVTSHLANVRDVMGGRRMDTEHYANLKWAFSVLQLAWKGLSCGRRIIILFR